MANQARSNPKPSNKPVARVSSGLLSVSIWEHEGKNGTFYTANAQRAFQRDGSEDWEHTDSFSRDDLPVVAALLLQAHAGVCRREQENRKQGAS